MLPIEAVTFPETLISVTPLVLVINPVMAFLLILVLNTTFGLPVVTKGWYLYLLPFLI